MITDLVDLLLHMTACRGKTLAEFCTSKTNRQYTELF